MDELAALPFAPLRSTRSAQSPANAQQALSGPAESTDSPRGDADARVLRDRDWYMKSFGPIRPTSSLDNGAGGRLPALRPPRTRRHHTIVVSVGIENALDTAPSSPDVDAVANGPVLQRRAAAIVGIGRLLAADLRLQYDPLRRGAFADGTSRPDYPTGVHRLTSRALSLDRTCRRSTDQR